MASLSEYSELIHTYFILGLTHRQIQHMLQECDSVNTSLRQLKRILARMHLCRRKDYADLQEVIQFVERQLNVSGTGILHGYRWMYHKCINSGVNCRREDIRVIIQNLDPQSVQFRQARRLHRRDYYAHGPNFIWHVDSYDKLKPFGICINGSIDGFSRKIMWLNCYVTSSDPKVIASYYIETVSNLGFCPKLVRTDDGTENVDLLRLHAFLRRNGTDCLAGDRSSMTGASTHNQRIESWWGILRKECTEFWLVLCHELKNSGDFDGGYLDRNIMQFCFMALIQDDLDSIAETWNNHYIRRSRNPRVPFGRPNVMFACPQLHGAQDESHNVACADIDMCTPQCTFRVSRSCEDVDIYDLCLAILNEQGLDLPHDVDGGLELYRKLRSEITALV